MVTPHIKELISQLAERLLLFLLPAGRQATEDPSKVLKADKATKDKLEEGLEGTSRRRIPRAARNQQNRSLTADTLHLGNFLEKIVTLELEDIRHCRINRRCLGEHIIITFDDILFSARKSRQRFLADAAYRCPYSDIVS